MKNNKINIFDLQRFTEGEPTEPQLENQSTETLTVEMVNKIVSERISQTKKHYDLELEKKNKELEILKGENEKIKSDNFSKMSEEERQKAIDEEKYSQLNLQLQKTNEELASYKRAGRKGELLQEFSKDNLPCADKFAELAHVISDIDDEKSRLEAYIVFKNYVESVVSHIKKENLKVEKPISSTTSIASENPFKDKNFTNINAIYIQDPKRAKELWVEAGSDSTYAGLFK